MKQGSRALGGVGGRSGEAPTDAVLVLNKCQLSHSNPLHEKEQQVKRVPLSRLGSRSSHKFSETKCLSCPSPPPPTPRASCL